jgi:hypothetical protein
LLLSNWAWRSLVGRLSDLVGRRYILFDLGLRLFVIVFRHQLSSFLYLSCNVRRQYSIAARRLNDAECRPGSSPLLLRGSSGLFDLSHLRLRFFFRFGLRCGALDRESANLAECSKLVRLGRLLNHPLISASSTGWAATGLTHKSVQLRSTTSGMWDVCVMTVRLKSRDVQRHDDGATGRHNKFSADQVIGSASESQLITNQISRSLRSSCLALDLEETARSRPALGPAATHVPRHYS